MKISSNLRQALRTHGFAKLASEVRRARGEAFVAPEALDGNLARGLGAAVEVLSHKIAASRVNDAEVAAGLAAYRRLEEGA